MQMLHAAIYDLPRPTIFFHFISKTTRYSEKKLPNVKYVLWFSLQILSETFLILRRIERDMIRMYIGLHVKYSLFLWDFNETWVFSTDFRKKNLQIPNFMKIRPVGTELFHSDGRMDGRTDVTKLIVAFRNFANAPKNPSICSELKMWITTKGDWWTLLYAPWHEAILYLRQENIYTRAAALRSSSNLVFRRPTTFPSSGLWIRNPGDKDEVSL